MLAQATAELPAARLGKPGRDRQIYAYGPVRLLPSTLVSFVTGAGGLWDQASVPVSGDAGKQKNSELDRRGRWWLVPGLDESSIGRDPLRLTVVGDVFLLFARSAIG